MPRPNSTLFFQMKFFSPSLSLSFSVSISFFKKWKTCYSERVNLQGPAERHKGWWMIENIKRWCFPPCWCGLRDRLWARDAALNPNDIRVPSLFFFLFLFWENTLFMREICHSNNISARHTGNTFSIYSFPFFMGLISFPGTCKEIVLFIYLFILQGPCDGCYAFRIKGWLKLFKGQTQAGFGRTVTWISGSHSGASLECLHIYIREFKKKIK